jgi:hypothetical protein
MNLTPAQKTLAIIFTVAIAIAMIVISMVCNAKFQNSLPAAPVLQSENMGNKKEEIENYKNLSTALKENNGYLFDTLVVKVLKPMFDTLLASIVAFIFAKPLLEALVVYLSNKKK